uniref:Uncharacterized protein n=1 Tax=Ciona intestinalis TaxID=7719 RepID=F6W149_CIOIN
MNVLKRPTDVLTSASTRSVALNATALPVTSLMTLASLAQTTTNVRATTMVVTFASTLLEATTACVSLGINLLHRKTRSVKIPMNVPWKLTSVNKFASTNRVATTVIAM